MAKAVYGSSLSANIVQTPEGFLVCKNVPIARTGTQQYLGSELGVDERPNEIFTVYREEDEVFKDSAISSFEGKPFVDEHPDDWVTPLNAQTYTMGSVKNVRRGVGDDSKYLLADIVVYNQSQIDEILNKQKREISCGYECQYVPYKDGFKQVDIIGNHVALVSAGRAGSKVAIKDNKSTNKENERRFSMAGKVTLPRRGSASNFLKSLGLKVLAQDAEPEDIMEAVDELVEEKIQNERDAEPIVIESSTNDEDIEEVKNEIENVKDAIYALLARDAEIEEVEVEDEDEIEEVEDEDLDDGCEALDAFEGELSVSKDEDMQEEIESVEVSPEEVEDEDEVEETEMTSDSMIEFIRAIKPLVANIPNPRERKRVGDNLARVLRKQMRAKKNSNNSVYSAMNYRTHDSRVNRNVDLGMEIAKKFNPTYMDK